MYSPEEVARIEWNEKMRVLDVCGVTRKFWRARLDQIPPRVRTKIEAYFLGMGLYVWGPVGVGKTYALSALILKQIEDAWPKQLSANEICRNDFYDGPLPLLVGEPDMFARIRGSFNGGDYTENEIIEEYTNKKTLLIDDVGVAKPTEYVMQTLYQIINGRYEEERQTVFSSNLSPDELADRVGARIASRIIEMCKLVKIEGKDRRLDQAKRSLSLNREGQA